MGRISVRDLIAQILAPLDKGSWRIKEHDSALVVTIGEMWIAFDRADRDIALSFEKLADVVGATLAFRRAQQMIGATGVVSKPVPLWLVSGSGVLANWLHWAGASNALRKVLSLTANPGVAPVSGYLDRRARRELGQGGARVRVRGGLAVAERIELSDRPRCVAMLGERALIRIEDHRLPETMVAGLQEREGSNTRRRLAEVVSHPFFAAADLVVAGVTQDRSAVVFEVDHHWTPLEPVPAAALEAVPKDFDPAFPWRATASERRRLNGLVEEARHRLATRRGRH